MSSLRAGFFLLMHPLRLPILVLLLLASTSLTAQQGPYRTSLSFTLPSSLLGGGIGLSGHLYQRTFSPLDQPSLLALDRQNLPAFDRIATRAWRPQVSRISDIGLLAGSLSPLVLLARRQARNDWKTHLLIWWQVASWTDGITTWVKALSLRPRPFTYYYAATYPQVPESLEEAVGKRDSRFSFFSGHSSFTTANCFLAARMFSDYYPNSPARKWVWAGAAVLPAAVAFLRVRAGKHYPSDVITGYLLGAAVGLAIPTLHRRR